MNHVENFGKAIGYGLYILGGSIPVGLARMAISGVYIFKHMLVKSKVEDMKKAKEVEINQSNQQAEKKTDKAFNDVKKSKSFSSLFKGVGNLTKAKVNEVTTKIGNTLEGAEAKLNSNTILFKERTLKDAWVSEFARGIIECIPIVGAIYFTNKDLGRKSITEITNLQSLLTATKGPGFFGCNDIEALMNFEDDLNNILR